MAGRYGDIDYPQLTKRAFAVGLGLFLVGLLGELIIHGSGMTVPAWENTLLIDAELLGILVMLFSPIIFGVVMPLTE